MTRQTERQNARISAKADLSHAKQEGRKAAKRVLLERQTVREKSGFYSGRSVGASIAPSRSRIDKRKVRKGKAFGRIIISFTEGSREFEFHATKGWRSHRAA